MITFSPWPVRLHAGKLNGQLIFDQESPGRYKNAEKVKLLKIYFLNSAAHSSGLAGLDHRFTGSGIFNISIILYLIYLSIN